ncbi:MAG: transcriptional coactivator PipX [Prochlorotrichaceae cyanobacterium]
MSSEIYLNHPDFGLLFRVCEVEANRDLFATLYAQRLFFVVTINDRQTLFEPITRADARLMVESRLRVVRRQGNNSDYSRLQTAHKQAFL